MVGVRFLMTGDFSPLVVVVNRLSDLQKEQIETLYAEDAAFREICHDYAECLRMRDRYANAPQDRHISRYRQEYELLIEALEEEIRLILTEEHASAKDQRETCTQPKFIDREGKNYEN